MNRNDYSLLIDYYGDLLTSHQLDILKMYYFEDYSMNEISENLEISKAAVSDIIKRSTSQLVLYEDKLKFIDHDKSIIAICDEMNSNDLLKDYANRIRKIVKG